jgi:acetyltransferase
VLKVSGPIHKTDVNGVTLNVNTEAFAKKEIKRMLTIKGADGVLIQEMIKGIEFFAGASKEDRIGHVVLVGLGGIYIEILKDIQATLAPFDEKEAKKMIRRLRSYPLLKGSRGKKGSDEKILIDILVKISSLLHHFPEITELDLNPLMANEKRIDCVDVRIRI